MEKSNFASKIKRIKKINLNNKMILSIYPGTWFKFSSKTKNALFVNLIDGIHRIPKKQ